jgi:hypothetical protein
MTVPKIKPSVRYTIDFAQGNKMNKVAAQSVIIIILPIPENLVLKTV